MARIALCFFGMNRCLSLTNKSIIENIINANNRKHEFDIYGALMVPPEQFTNIRSNELSCSVENNFNEILNPLSYETIAQEAFDNAISGQLEKLLKHDTYTDDFQSIKNISRELFSVKRVYMLTSEKEYDYFLFVRPDLYYCNPFNLDKYIHQLEMDNSPRIFTPFWQKWTGLNDRFAFCNSAGAITYSKRFEMLWIYSDDVGEPLHAERLLLFTCLKLKTRFDIQLNEFALRIRASGKIHVEEYGECGSYLSTLSSWNSLEFLQNLNLESD